MTSRENKPVFVALEGGEGAGKSTQAQLLVTRLQQEGRHGHSWSTNPEQPRWVNALVLQRRFAIKGPLSTGFMRDAEPHAMTVLCGMIVSVIPFKNPLLHR